jgi:CBS domain-containing protein
MKVRDVMTKDVATISGWAPVAEAARLMRDRGVGALPVMTNGNPVGFITDRDIVVRAVAQGLDAARTPISDIMTLGIDTCRGDATIEEAAVLMESRKVRRLLVLDREKEPAGIVSLDDLAVRTHNAQLVEEVLEAVARATAEGRGGPACEMGGGD